MKSLAVRVDFLAVLVSLHVNACMYASVCVISAGEQRTSRAAGNQSRGFPDSEERRCIREHVTVAVANECWRQFTKELESLLWLLTPPSPLPLPLLCTVCTVCCHISLHFSPYIFFLRSSPFSWTFCSMMPQSRPLSSDSDTSHVHTHLPLFLCVCWYSCFVC